MSKRKKGTWGISKAVRSAAARRKASAKKAGRYGAGYSQSVAVARREYCASRNRTDALGRHLGMLTGTHKKARHSSKRHVKCRVSR